MNFSYFKYLVYRVFINPLFYLTSLVLNLFCFSGFFISGNFFTQNGSTDLSVLFNFISYFSVILIPLFTFDSYSENNLSLPFSPWHKILSTFFSIIFELFASLIPLFIFPLFLLQFGSVDFAQYFAGFFFIFLYFSLAVSFSIFIFEIFEKSLQALIISVVFLFVINFSYIFALSFLQNKVFSSIFKFLSFSWHFDSASKGILDSRDVFYFLFLTLLFIILALFSKLKKCGKVFFKESKASFFFILLILIFGFLNSTRYYFRKDLTSQKKYTISEYSKEVLNSFDEKIEISYFISPVLKSLYPDFKRIEDFLVEFSRNKNIRLKIVVPDEKKQDSLLKNYGIYPRQIQRKTHNKTEFIDVYSSIVIEKSGTWKIIPFVFKSEDLEYNLLLKILELSRKKERILNVVHSLSCDFFEYYSYLNSFLEENGFTVKNIPVTDENFYENLSKSSLTLVLGEENLSRKNSSDIESYLLDGNKVFFALNPYNVDFENDWHISEVKSKNLTDMIESYGLYFSSALLNDVSCARITMQSYTNLDGSPAQNYIKQLNYPFWIEILPQQNALSGLTLFWPAALTLPENAFPVLYSSNLSYLVDADFENPENLFEVNAFKLEEIGFNPKKSVQKNFPVAAFFSGNVKPLYSEKDESFIQFLLITDPLFCADLMLGYIGNDLNPLRNLDFMLTSLLKLNGEEELASLKEKSFSVNLQSFYKVKDESAFIRAKKIILIYSFLIVPVLFIILFLISKKIRRKIIKFYGDF